MNYRRANNALLVLIILLNGYVLLAPFIPKLEVWWQLRHSDVSARLSQQIHASTTPPAARQQNRIVIPSMGLDEAVHEASYANRYKALDEGIWRYNKGSSPDKGSNTVLAGHRFTYTSPRGVFYALDKVKAGDQLAVYWNGQKHLYQVSETKVVKASDVGIQSPTTASQLTLFTCTPLWRPTDRLVVIAKEII